jgi:hypothetical protein
MKQKNKSLIQWHPAFYAGIQIELKEYADHLSFENEHQLSNKPLALDILIIKNSGGIKISKNIGRIFRNHNIVEYKSPTDYFSIDNYYKILSYACLYKSESKKSNSIGIEDITISIVCPHFPKKLADHLEKMYGYKMEQVDNGIYYIIKENPILPTQIIVSSELDYETNMWIAGLTNDMTDSNKARRLLQEYKKHSNSALYSSVITAVVNANPIFKGGDFMCKAIEDLYRDAFNEMVAKEVDKQVSEQVAQKVSEQVAQTVAQTKDALAQKDNELAQKDDALAQTKDALAQKDILIAQLQKQIAQLQQAGISN